MMDRKISILYLLVAFQLGARSVPNGFLVYVRTSEFFKIGYSIFLETDGGVALDEV